MTTSNVYFIHRRFVHFLIFVTSVFALQDEEEKIFMNQFAVHINHSHHRNIADEIAEKHGFVNLGKIGNLNGYYLFEHNHVSKRAADPSHEHHEKLDTEPHVSWVEQQSVLKRVKRDLIYSDFGPNAGRAGYLSNFGSAFRPSYTGDFPDPMYGKQWYLHQGAVDNWDMNILGAWKKGYTGYGVVVSILDDGIQTNHPDLARNYDPMASTDINGNDDDPMPQDNGDNKHGTRCAGEVAGVAFNDVCGVGVAFNASIGGVRMLDGTVNDAVEAKALSLNRNHIDIYSASWGPEDDGKTVDGPGPLARRAFIDGVTQGRNYKGSIFVWASGNGGRHVDNCNCDGYTNSIFTLSISSVTQRGLKPWYLEECSSTLATTYSSGTPAHDKNIVTVDMDPTFHPDTMCTQDHTGTSASAPIAAAICALALEANPNLSWRDMQYLVVLTSRPEPLMKEEGWQTNGVNRKVSHKFGYGLMDATAMVNLAEQWMTVPSQHICETLEDSFQRPISKEFGDKLEIYMNTDACWNTPNVVNYLEHVQCRMTLRFNPRGNLKIILESPSGTKSVLLSPRPKDIYQTDFQDWPFLSVHYWGERAAGQWKLTILNAGSMNSPEPGILKKWSLVFHGTEQHPIHLRSHPPSGYQFPGSGHLQPGATVIQIREDAQSEDCHKECRGGCYANGPEHCKECRHFQTDGELRMCVKSCSDGQYADKNNTCKQCHVSCKTCTNSTSFGCLSCAEGKFVEGKNQCVKTCPPSYFERGSDKMCVACSSMCSSCFGEADNCTACKKGLVAFGNKCMAACPKKMYEGDNQRCFGCHSSCETCMGPLENQCVTCPSDLVHWNGTCIKFCPNGYFAHEQTNECYNCDHSCLTCNASRCLTCRPGWTLNNNTEGRCQLKTECAKGFFLKNDNCVPCHGSCDTCEGPAYSQCLTCPPHLILFKNTCVSKCPPNTILVKGRGCLPCHETCAACNGLKANHCTACKHGLVLRNHTCSTVCGERMYASKKMCLSCHLTCLTCSGPSDEDCLTCPPDLQLGNGKCQESCPSGSFPRNNSCHPCHHTCLTCSGDDLNSCISCRDSLVLDSGLCMECQQGLYYDVASQQCKPCDPSCTTCNGPDPYSCLSCTQPLKHDAVSHSCVSCCTTGHLDNCCICDHRTDTCINVVSNDNKRIVVIDGTIKTVDELNGFSYSTFGIVALLTCSVVIALFLVAFKLSQFRSHYGCCWGKGYQRLPVRSETKIEQLMDFAQDDFWDDNDHIRT